MIIIGIDPGFGRLGYAIFEKNSEKEKLLEYSCIETDSKQTYNQRIMVAAEKIESLILKFTPDYIAIEKIFFNKNQKTALQTAEIKGIVSYLALKNNVDILEYTPLEVKSAVCGYGKADKNQIKKMVNMILGLKISTKFDDTTDAIALCLTCLARRDYCGKNKK